MKNNSLNVKEKENHIHGTSSTSNKKDYWNIFKTWQSTLSESSNQEMTLPEKAIKKLLRDKMRKSVQQRSHYKMLKMRPTQRKSREEANQNKKTKRLLSLSCWLKTKSKKEDSSCTWSVSCIHLSEYHSLLKTMSTQPSTRSRREDFWVQTPLMLRCLPFQTLLLSLSLCCAPSCSVVLTLLSRRLVSSRCCMRWLRRGITIA